MKRLFSLLFVDPNKNVPSAWANISQTPLTVVYPPNINRPRSVVKTWNVYVKTAEPDIRYEDHAEWMYNIQLNRLGTKMDIHNMEMSELRFNIDSYASRGYRNRSVIPQNKLKRYE